jgi:hypothetical protein
MKKWMKILLGVVAVIALAIAAVFYFTAGMVDTANDFFKAVKQKDFAKARSYLSEDFKASTDEKVLVDFLSNSAILSFKESSWSNRQISGNRGELEGSITTETGGVVPIKITFVKENGSWKIYALQKPAAGLQSQSSSPAIPGKAEQVTLVKQSMHDFVLSLQNKNMEHFHSTLSRLWQQQNTTEQLNQAFKAIVDSGANWPVLENLDPIMGNEPKVDDVGVLLLSGYYPTKPSQVYFEHKYIYEGVSWKLAGFKIEAK